MFFPFLFFISLYFSFFSFSSFLFPFIFFLYFPFPFSLFLFPFIFPFSLLSFPFPLPPPPPRSTLASSLPPQPAPPLSYMCACAAAEPGRRRAHKMAAVRAAAASRGLPNGAGLGGAREQAAVLVRDFVSQPRLSECRTASKKGPGSWGEKERGVWERRGVLREAAGCGASRALRRCERSLGRAVCFLNASIWYKIQIYP